MLFVDFVPFVVQEKPKTIVIFAPLCEK